MNATRWMRYFVGKKICTGDIVDDNGEQLYVMHEYGENCPICGLAANHTGNQIWFPVTDDEAELYVRPMLRYRAFVEFFTAYAPIPDLIDPAIAFIQQELDKIVSQIAEIEDDYKWLFLTDTFTDPPHQQSHPQPPPQPTNHRVKRQ